MRSLDTGRPLSFFTDQNAKIQTLTAANLLAVVKKHIQPHDLIKLKAGDILIQRGTNHAWANRSDKRARVAFVLVDAEPLGIGSPVTGSHSAR